MPQKHPKPPCTRNCGNRKPGCHGKCEAWLEYERERNGFYQERLERKEQAKSTYPIRATKHFDPR